MQAGRSDIYLSRLGIIASLTLHQAIQNWIVEDKISFTHPSQTRSLRECDLRDMSVFVGLVPRLNFRT